MPNDNAEQNTEPTAAERVKTIVKEAIAESQPAISKTHNPSPAEIFGDSGTRIRVKAAGETYDHTKSVANHPKLGRPVYDECGRPAMQPSQLEQAKAGVYMKQLAARSGIEVQFTEHERGLWAEMLEKDTWCGKIGGEYRKGITGAQYKSLLDDATSGGQHVNPEWFDSNLIQLPLLTGELLPLVDLREVPRGSSIEGASVSNPTVQWGVAEGTSMSLFDTSSLVAAITSSVHNVTVALEVGVDFLSDAAADVGRILEENIAQRMAAELDKVIAVGDGTTQPTGLKNATGFTSVSSDNGNTGPWTVDDTLSALFGVGKQYRQSNRCAFVGNDTTYQRLRSISVTATDQRLVFGMEADRGSGASVEGYSILGRPFKIQNDLTNPELYFGDMAKYRMYRRTGFSVHWETGGKELRLKNLALLVVRGRFAGQPVDSSAFAEITDGQSS